MRFPGEGVLEFLSLPLRLQPRVSRCPVQSGSVNSAKTITVHLFGRCVMTNSLKRGNAFEFCAAMSLHRRPARSTGSSKSAGKNIAAGIRNDRDSFRAQ